MIIGRKYIKLKPVPISIFFMVVCCFIILLTGSSFSGTAAYAAQEDQKVYDFYGLFSDEEIADLEDICAEYGEDGKIDIVMIITDDLKGSSATRYLEDFYDEYGFGYNEEFGDTAMILVNMESGNRSVNIQGYGNAEYYLNNDRIEYILDDVALMLQDGSYYDSLEEFSRQAAYYMKEEKGVNTTPAAGGINSGNYYGESSYDGPSNYYGEKEDNIFYNTLFQLLIAIIIGAAAVGIMAVNSGGRVTVHNRTYLDEPHSGVVANRDDYIRTTTTRVKRPSNNNGKGGRSSGGGGISRGGHSHSGGGRSF